MSDSYPPAPGEFAAGSTLAGYRLDEVIGRGGMAVVYRAFDGRLHRRVALKVLAPELVRDEEFRQRFIRESRAAAAVDHPNILPIFEAGESDGMLFIAMRYVHGGDVRGLIDQHGALPPARACAITAQVASALDLAHAHGLVHRDVKPANMLRDETSYAGQPDHVYLSDFGLSKRSLGSANLTSRGHFLGTLNYVAPEQIEGRSVDGRADLYALACSAFEMLGGEPPFKRDDNMAIMWAQVNAPPPPLTGRARGLPKAVNDVMSTALAKRPGDRYVTCLEFATALAAACGLRGAEPQLARPPRQPKGRQPRGGGLSQLGLGRRGQSRRDQGQREPAPREPAPHELAPHELAPQEAAAYEAAQQQAAQERVAQRELARREAAERAARAEQARAEQAQREQIQGHEAQREQAQREQGRGEQGRGEQGRGEQGRGEQGRGEQGRGPSLQGPPLRREPTQPVPIQGAPTPGPGGPAGQVGGPGRPSLPPPVRPPGRRVPPPQKKRPWVARKSGATVVAACVAVLGAGGGYLLLSKSNQARPPHASHGTTGQVTSPRVITPPTCTTQVAAAGTLQNVPSHMVSVGRVPFDVVLAPGHFGFVSNGAGITVLNTARPVPSVLHTVALTSAQGEALTQDGKYLLVATGNGMTVFRSSTLEAGGSAPLGSLTVPGGNHAVEVTVTGDDRFAFVSIQQSNEVAVFNLQRALSAGFGPADVVGTIPVPKDPVGVTLSKDGKYLYVASGLARPAVQSGAGVLSVVSVQKAETSPKSSVLKNINAGCGPDRMAVSPDGRYLWLTAGGGNALLAYSTASLITDPTHALVAKVALGELPLGMIFVNHGTAIVVADSNRDKIASAAPNLAVVGVKQALAGQHGALVGLITSGTTPRQFALEPNGHTLLVTNTESGQLQAVNITHLP